MIEGAERKLNLPPVVTGFVLPFAVSTLRLSAATSWTVGALFVAPFFMAVGLPVEGIAILIALDAIPDILKGVLNVTAHMTAATVLAQGVQPVTPASRSSCRLHHPPTGRCGPKG